MLNIKVYTLIDIGTVDVDSGDRALAVGYHN